MYDYITNLNTHPFESYSRFCRSCRQIKGEVDYEGAKVLSRRIAELKLSTGDEDGIKIPASKEMRSLCLSLDDALYTLPSDFSTVPALHDLPCIKSLFATHLDCLVLSYQDNYCDDATQLNWLTPFVLEPDDPDEGHARAAGSRIELQLVVYSSQWREFKYRKLTRWALDDSKFCENASYLSRSAFAVFR